MKALSVDHGETLNSPEPSTRQIVALFEALAGLAKTRDHSRGLIIIIDELGKLLEHAALNPEKNDINVLQELAEAASRCQDNPLWFITILHQQFSQYASRLGRRQQKEWSKVQQRFFDVPCSLDGLDALQLTAAAMNGNRSDEIRNNRHICDIARACSSFAPRGSETDFENLCVACYPLHPIVVLLLPTLFRRFGQNERSLFSFLSADEPFSLITWLQNQTFEPDNPPFLRLPEIYDYCFHTLIGGAPSLQVTRAWSETEDTLARLGNSTEVELATLKSIAILNLVGDSSRLPASYEVLELALVSKAFKAEGLRNALNAFETRRLVVYRRFRSSYRLYEGSDVDIGERLTTAYQSIPTRSLSLFVAKELCPAQSVVARRHSFVKGMTRIFSVIPTGQLDLEKALKLKDSADGHVICCLVETDEQHMATESHLKTVTHEASIVIIAKETDQLIDAARDVAALNWVKHNTPGLSGDRVARQELGERQLEASIAFRSEWNRLFTTPNRHAVVFWRGERQNIISGKALAELVSRAADAIYPYAPTIQNELINRRSLSTATAAARRNLIEAMMVHSREERLGLSGHPPERSIYESVLKQSEIHRKNSSDEWEFGRPSHKDKGLQKAWDHVVDASSSDSLRPKPLDSLFTELCDPPFGVADGFVPVLFYACFHANSTTMALYETDHFIPDLTPPVMERLIRNPKNFSIVSFKVSGERAAVVERFSRGFGVGNHLLPVVRSLYARMATLNHYTEITQALPRPAIVARDVIMRAKSPERLLFVELPVALDCIPFEMQPSNNNQDNIENFFNALNSAFKSLITCYPALIERIKGSIFKVFDISNNDMNWRTSIPKRASILSEYVTDPGFRIVINRAIDTNLPPMEFIESIAAGIVGQPPNRWSRAEEESFVRLVAQLSTKARSIESMLDLKASLQDSDAGYLVTIDKKDVEGVRGIVRLTHSEKRKAERIAKEIIRKYATDVDTKVWLGAVAEVARQAVSSEREPTERSFRRKPTLSHSKPN
ncbi:hypothetical protein [Dehalogenimonas formicexedens]|uniref:hypothetical protein n=1 Tax=Dehalogenimonas formicexedens TaxID=1839801 RepID=UPI0011AB767B|nr:hypothetical protein [Dehalogenimonas formicexedens]